MKKNFTKLILLFFVSMLTIGAWGTPDKDYLCFTANTASSTVTLKKIGVEPVDVNLEYKTNVGEWIDYTIGTDITLENVGDKVYFRNKSDVVTGFSTGLQNFYEFAMTGSIAASGNVMSLVDKNVESTTIPCDYCFNALFCNCTSLTSAPELPATTLTSGCYSNMFSGTALETAPALPATTLADGCYSFMFSNCTALETAPELPATTVGDGGYEFMFRGCEKLNYVKVAFTSWSGEDGEIAENWLNGVAAEGTFVCPAELNTDEGYDFGYIPYGWIVEYTPITLNDNEAYTITKDVTTTVTYKRTFESTVWQPLYVPFSIDITADLLEKCDIADIFMVSTMGSVTAGADPLDAGLSVTVIKKYIAGESTVAHTPYFIRPKTTGDFEFTQEYTTVYAATEGMVDCTTTKDKYEFIGNYTAKTLSPTTGVAFYVLGTNGGLQCVAKTEDYNLAANRWHMKKTSRSNNPSALDADEKMSIVVLGEDDTTGIEGLNLNDNENENDNFNKAVYNLQGQRVGSFNGYRGIVIKGGKKYILK